MYVALSKSKHERGGRGRGDSRSKFRREPITLCVVSALTSPDVIMHKKKYINFKE